MGLGRDSRVNSAVTAGGKAAATAAANARAKAAGMQISTTSGSSSSSSRSVRHRDVLWSSLQVVSVSCFASVCALQQSTCADVRPVSKPGLKYECPVHTEFVPEEAQTFPPTQKACCKVRAGDVTADDDEVCCAAAAAESHSVSSIASPNLLGQHQQLHNHNSTAVTFRQ